MDSAWNHLIYSLSFLYDYVITLSQLHKQLCHSLSSNPAVTCWGIILTISWRESQSYSIAGHLPYYNQVRNIILLWNPKVHNHVHKGLSLNIVLGSLYLILGYLNLAHNFTPLYNCFICLYFQSAGLCNTSFPLISGFHHALLQSITFISRLNALDYTKLRG